MAFSYFGSKSKLIGFYPIPKYGVIIEPFAGSARYACYYPENEVHLYDISPTIAGIWKWIIGATLEDIRNLPELKVGEDLRDYKQLSQPERDLLGFTVNRGKEYPRNVVTRWCGNETRLVKNRLLDFVPRIRHWKVYGQSYEAAPDVKATWFVDPPYAAFVGKCYPHDEVEYSELAAWAKSRQGLTIVCEGEGADWLPFRRLRQTRYRGMRKESVDMVYIQDTGDGQ